MKLRLPTILLALSVAACSPVGNIEDGGIYTVRSACPQVAIPAGTGDMTLFDPAGQTDAGAIDVVATMTGLRSTCDESGSDIVSTATFQVVALRRDATAARQVVLPYFDVVVQGGNSIAAKKVGNIGLNFAAGSHRAATTGQATVRVNRAAATLPENVRDVLTRRRKVGEQDAAIDPLSDPAIREAVARATFQHLVGFHLSDQQLRYNATR